MGEKPEMKLCNKKAVLLRKALNSQAKKSINALILFSYFLILLENFIVSIQILIG